MSSKPTNKPPKQNEHALQRKQNVPVQLTDLSIFDNTYAYMKERFAQEMKRIDQQMNKFSSDLNQYYGQSSDVQSGLMSSRPESVNWDILTNSPLVQGEGEDKTLKLQFDVSHFDPTEIKVKILNDLLVISANHEEKTDDTTVYREYNREFKLPPGTDPERVVSSLSRDGVLTIQAPLPQPIDRSILPPHHGN
uniref:SHSP domain-containing protein n=1 Tax=Heliothis virescens TaxID=7102 RepID=A0A2A4JVE0_HELVI